MTGRLRGGMLALLSAVAAASISLIVATWIKGRISDVASRIARYERALVKLSSDEPGWRDDPGESLQSSTERIEMLSARLERERRHFHRPGELSISEFSSEIQRSLNTFGLSVRRYRPVDSASSQREERMVEFVVRGRAESLLSFLAGLSRSQKFRPIPTVTIHRRGGGLVDANFRIGYEELEVGSPQ